MERTVVGGQVARGRQLAPHPWLHLPPVTRPPRPRPRPRSTIDSLPADKMRHTLVVTALREPIARVISSFWYLRKQPGGENALCPHGPNSCIGLANYTRNGLAGGWEGGGGGGGRALWPRLSFMIFEQYSQPCAAAPALLHCATCHAGELPLNRQVRVLSGEYCCYQRNRHADDDARLETALANLDRVGAVIISEHMSESLQVRQAARMCVSLVARQPPLQTALSDSARASHPQPSPPTPVPTLLLARHFCRCSTSTGCWATTARPSTSARTSTPTPLSPRPRWPPLPT